MAICYYCIEDKAGFMDIHQQFTCHDCYGAKFKTKKRQRSFTEDTRSESELFHDLQKKWNR